MNLAGWAFLSSVLLLALGLALLWLAHRQRERTGLPAGEVVYSDTGARHRVERPLFSRRYRLSGKPDYLVLQGDAVIPVEVKPKRTATSPYSSDVLQLAAYGLLVEENYGQASPYGIVSYANASFRVPFTPELRQRLFDTLAALRADLHAQDVEPSHNSPQRCLRCGHRGHCEKRLA
ncbi:MAG: Dna2/Cas4 domain-containing protein [Chloroflexi bacterium]|nr:Dna2/Cas4 domain-containing protein [Chloroflexota bacterium]